MSKPTIESERGKPSEWWECSHCGALSRHNVLDVDGNETVECINCDYPEDVARVDS